MMDKSYTVINKGNFPAEQAAGFVALDQFLFVKENGGKFLLLKFQNGRDESVTSVRVCVMQKDARGNDLGRLTAVCPVKLSEPNAPFFTHRRIALHEECTDFDIKILSADFGCYRYSPQGNGLALSYAGQEPKSAPAAARQKTENSVAERKYKTPILVCIIMLAMLALSTALTFGHMQIFLANSDTFFYKGVEYAFADNERSDTADIIAVGSDGKTKNIVIEDKVKGHKVIGISKQSKFSINFDKDIKGLTVKAAIVIPDGAFYGFKNLARVDLGKATEVGVQAFYNCVKLKTVTAKNLRMIGSNAFAGCSALEKVTISNNASALRFGSYPFLWCGNLKNLDIDQFIDYEYNEAFLQGSNPNVLRLRNFNYSFQIGGKNYISTETQKLTDLFGGIGTGSTVQNELIIDYCNAVPDNFCYSTALKSVTIKNGSFTAVGSSAFCNNPSLQSVNLPNPLTDVESYAFYNTGINDFDGKSLNYIGEYAFGNCQNLTDFNLRDNTTLNDIGNNAFEDCLSLKSIFIPETIAQIKEYTFYGCGELSEVTGGASLTRIGYSAFRDCYTLSAVPVENAESVETYAFLNCASLRSLEFSNSLISIGNYAFSGCESLETLGIYYGLESIGEYAFYGCESLTAINVPVTVSAIDMAAFGGCTSLTQMTLPFIGGSYTDHNDFSYIFGSGAESVPEALRAVRIKSASRIDASAFLGCAYLEEIVIEDGYTGIGDNAFYGCNRLNKFIIQPSVISIGTDAFRDCFKLYELYNLSYLNLAPSSSNHGMAGYYAFRVHQSLSATPMEIISYGGFEFAQDNAGEWFLINVDDTASSLTLPSGVPASGGSFYEVVQHLILKNSKVNNIVVSEAVTAIGEYAFSKCTALQSVTIHSEVASIGFGALSGCSMLREITLPFLGGRVDDQFGYLGYIFGGERYDDSQISGYLKTVTLTRGNIIAETAFYGCGMIERVNLPDTVKTIGRYAFTSTGITAITLPSGLLAIGSYAFGNCYQLTEINFPASLHIIDEYAFSYSNLEKVTVNGNIDIRYGAFIDCTSLYEVYNYGGMNIVAGSNDNGYIAYYAHKVYS